MAATWIFIMQSMLTAQATQKQKLHNTSSYEGIGFCVDCSEVRGIVQI